MLTRRMALLGAGGLAGLGLIARSGRPGPAVAAEGSFEIVRTEAEWRAALSPEAYAVLREEATERPFTSPLLSESREGTFPAPSAPRRIARSGWCAPRSTARAAAATSATSSRTARHRPACATASTAWR
jgi:hypothetical protein